MAKSKTRGKRRKASLASAQPIVKAEIPVTQRPVAPARAINKSNSMSGMIMPAMVALGCWGLALSFTFFTTEQNHLLFGGIAALMAVMWSVSLGLRVQKARQRR